LKRRGRRLWLAVCVVGLCPARRHVVVGFIPASRGSVTDRALFRPAAATAGLGVGFGTLGVRAASAVDWWAFEASLDPAASFTLGTFVGVLVTFASLAIVLSIFVQNLQADDLDGAKW
ncbi:unnamed protein product, partial [Polarella glacialis]